MIFDIALVPLFFQIYNLLISKIEIFLKYFLDKNHQKQSLWELELSDVWVYGCTIVSSPLCPTLVQSYTMHGAQSVIFWKAPS